MAALLLIIIYVGYMGLDIPDWEKWETRISVPR